jgi:hypothetical protein
MEMNPEDQGNTNEQKENMAAGQQPSPPDLEPEFTWVDSVRPVNRVIRRDPAGGVLEVTGYLQMNAEGSDMWDGIAVERGLDPETATARFAVNEVNRTVAAFPVASGDKGGTRVVRNDGRQAHVMHLCNVFDEHRSLRPDGKRDVILSRRVGPDGKPYLLIDLQTAQTKPTGTREGSKEHQRRADAKARREQRQKGPGTQG